MRSLGEFCGHIARGIRKDVGEKREVSRTVEEERVETSRGAVTLRRTVIEEVEIPPERPDPS